MVVLFVHGMGRSPISGWPMLRELRSTGVRTKTFGYFVSLESFASIRSRLVARLEAISRSGRYIVVGHSLGGVLLRAALQSLPDHVMRPEHVVLLGSPITAPALAQRLGRHLIFRLFTGDCGQLLASSSRMAMLNVPMQSVTAIVGVKGIILTKHFFGESVNDGVVATAETAASWFQETKEVPVMHTLLPSSRHVTHIVKRLVSDNPKQYTQW